MEQFPKPPYEGPFPNPHYEKPPSPEGSETEIASTVYFPIPYEIYLPEGSQNPDPSVIKENITSISEGSSLEKVSSKPSYNVSLKKRYSKVSVFSKNSKGSKKETEDENSPDLDKVCTLITKKLESEESLIGYPKFLCKKTEYLDLLTCFDSESINKFKEDCHKIEGVFLNCTKIDCETRLNNLNILSNLYQLVSCGGGIQWKPREKVVHFITHYLCQNPYLLSQLVYIITDSEDLETCFYSIKILHELLVRGDRFKREDRAAMVAALSSPKTLQTLIKSMYFIDIRFTEDLNYSQGLQKMHCQILEIITTICKTEPCKNELKYINEGTVKLIGKLTSKCYRNRDLASCLLDALKTITLRRENCKYLTNKNFFDGLCFCCKLTNKLFTTTKVLEAMSRGKFSLESMSENKKLIDLILNLIFYNGKKTINKQSLLTILYRVVNTENGFKFFSTPEMFHKLYQHFVKNEKHISRIETIKAYTILNRIVNVQILPCMKLRRGENLPKQIKDLMEYPSEDDETNEESQNDDVSVVSDFPITVEEEEEQEPLSDLCPFYIEQLLSTGKKDYCNVYQFKIYEGVLDIFSKKIIESRVHRAKNMNNLAYPDSLMLEPEFDDHTFSLSVNHFSIKKLIQRLKCLQGMQKNLFSPRIVYDLDELEENSTSIPQPSTFSHNPKKIQVRPQTSKHSLNFESRFESGNLRKAIQIGKYEYELQLTPDTNTTQRGFQWFYFQVTNMVPKVYYTFNIINFLAFDSQYNSGMQPLMFSVTDYTLNKTGWKRIGKGIIYYGNNFINEKGGKQYKTLQFSFQFLYSNDYVYFAYHYPYTYTRLMIILYPLVRHKTKHVYARVDRLCKTVNNKNEVALVTITGAWNRTGTLGIPLIRRPIIFITGRIHPGETNSSWIIEGIIKFLLRETDPNAIKAREHFIFKIIPMLNPEGVIYGNTRCGLTGADLNRSWNKPNKLSCPEIFYAKRLIGCAKKVLHLPIAAYIDIHGHSHKKFFFLYGCNPMDSWKKGDRSCGDFSEILKVLPEMVHSTNPNINLAECKNMITKEKESSGRVVMWREFDIKQSFTLECSFSFANEIQTMNTKILSNIGVSIISSLGKIADKVYSSGKSIPSLSLDYGNMNYPRKLTHVKHKKANRTSEQNDLEESYSEQEL